ncbi:MAG: hypothetical protein RLY93_16350 [Sumerlaeia bacterium]
MPDTPHTARPLPPLDPPKREEESSEEEFSPRQEPESGLQTREQAESQHRMEAEFMAPFTARGKPLRRAANTHLGLLLFALIIALSLGALRFDAILDEANTVLQYAQNWSDGAGMRADVNAPPAEGYASFLWTFIAGVHAFYMEKPADALLFYNRLFGVLIVLGVWWEMLRRGAFGQRWLWLALGLTALHPSLHHWMMGGLETHFFGFLLLIGVARFLREEFAPETAPNPWSTIPLSLAVLTRPEAYFIVILLFAVLIARRALESTGKRRRRERKTPGAWMGWRRVLLWALPILTVVILHFVWRYNYYGELFPDKFLAQGEGADHRSGLVWAGLFLKGSYFHWAVPLALAIVAISAFAFQGNPLTGQALVLTVLLAFYLLYAALSGGEIHEFRLLAPTLGLWALWVPMTIENLRLWAAERSEVRYGPRALLTGVLFALSSALLFRMMWTTIKEPHADTLWERGHSHTATYYQELYNEQKHGESAEPSAEGTSEPEESAEDAAAETTEIGE